MKNLFAKKNPDEVQITVGGASRILGFIELAVLSIGGVGAQVVLLMDQIAGSIEQYAVVVTLIVSVMAVVNLIRYILKASPPFYGKTHIFANNAEAQAWVEKNLKGGAA